MCESDTTGPIGNMRNDQVIALVIIEEGLVRLIG